MMRLARLEDLAAVQSVTEAAYEPYRALLGGPPLPVTEDYAPRIHREEVWVREHDTVISALAVLERHADHVMVFSLAVAPSYQGQGHGIALLQFTDGKAAEWDLPEVRLYTNSRMERNIALYRAYGFQETGRRPNPHRPGWMLVDMARSIKD
ncbi:MULTISPECIES: GNAT family N-acetyltransferase [unclassified Ensifer]|uniref:GNAT family N-acetyltransferase n=1 Tax=unclassified Ensifer TaxID=2633371 RepID=UPI000812C96A|nr:MULTISPECIES: GNAT family N-acetyltransferase [unclassified Ensifer]OCP01043.1 acetyltransferase [Ensifer sp. LC11]OCP01617.1 acetyltransferase [Ensifer sp. LC13]OCP02165.1 acetyltransferase [Ensifer sp. LC14]OCP30003.1 acetyltransferase [Ensifer sp. LC499]